MIKCCIRLFVNYFAIAKSFSKSFNKRRFWEKLLVSWDILALGNNNGQEFG